MDLSLVSKSSDVVLIGVFVLMSLMDVVTWSVVVIRCIKYCKAEEGNIQVKELMLNAFTLADVVQEARTAEVLMSRVADESLCAYQNYRQTVSKSLIDELSLGEYLIVHVHNSMPQTMRQFDYGMTALASIDATAPFIGLLGTAWGIYHTLIGINGSDQMSIVAVTGPIDETLVSTTVGLLVAIPTVSAYSFLNRDTEIIAQDMDTSAYDLHVRLLDQKG